jgi:hypothetical protein
MAIPPRRIVDDFRLDLAESRDCGRHHYTGVLKARTTAAEAGEGILARERGEVVGARKPEIGAEFHGRQLACRSHAARETGIITAARLQAGAACQQPSLQAVQAYRQ